MRKYIWSLVLVLMVSSSNLFSQPTLCPPLEYGVKWSKFKAEATTRTNNGKENSGTVEYWISENYEIVFDWTTFKNNNPFLDDETVK